MPFVVDASVAATWVMPDEVTIDSVLTRLEMDYAVVPQLWWFEIWNILATGERRKRIDEQGATEALDFYYDLPIETDPERPGPEIVFLSRKYNLTGYDAAYLELARRKKLPLATVDGALITAAPKEGVTLIPTS